MDTPAYTLTRGNCDFPEWFETLRRHAAREGSAVSNADSWRSGYDEGRTPAEEWSLYAGDGHEH